MAFSGQGEGSIEAKQLSQRSKEAEGKVPKKSAEQSLRMQQHQKKTLCDKTEKLQSSGFQKQKPPPAVAPPTLPCVDEIMDVSSNEG